MVRKRGLLRKTQRAGNGDAYSSIGKLTGAPPTEDEYAAIARALKPVARHAALLGLELGLEPCNRYETHLVNQGRQGVELIERIGEDNVFVHLDTYPYEHRGKRPGTGNVDWDSVFTGLAEIGFDGDMVLESFMVIHPDIARALSVWRPVASSSEELVDKGFGFLRDRAAAHGLTIG